MVPWACGSKASCPRSLPQVPDLHLKSLPFRLSIAEQQAQCFKGKHREFVFLYVSARHDWNQTGQGRPQMLPKCPDALFRTSYEDFSVQNVSWLHAELSKWLPQASAATSIYSLLCQGKSYLPMGLSREEGALIRHCLELINRPCSDGLNDSLRHFADPFVPKKCLQIE